MKPEAWKAQLNAKQQEERQALRENDRQHPARPNCRYCGKPLARYRWRLHSPRQWGGNGDNLFCTLTHGYLFGVTVATTVPGLSASVAYPLRKSIDEAKT